MSGYTVRLQCSIVYNGAFAAFSFQRVVGFISTVTRWCSIAAKTSPYQPGAKSCNLCLAEKLAILQSNPATTLNKRSELNNKCRTKKNSN